MLRLDRANDNLLAVWPIYVDFIYAVVFLNTIEIDKQLRLWAQGKPFKSASGTWFTYLKA